jgi:hypothetical protein
MLVEAKELDDPACVTQDSGHIVALILSLVPLSMNHKAICSAVRGWTSFATAHRGGDAVLEKSSAVRFVRSITKHLGLESSRLRSDYDRLTCCDVANIHDARKVPKRGANVESSPRRRVDGPSRLIRPIAIDAERSQSALLLGSRESVGGPPFGDCLYLYYVSRIPLFR